jgi:hypothetical protein
MTAYITSEHVQYNAMKKGNFIKLSTMCKEKTTFITVLL